jgi:hypothetical protein
MLDRVEHVSWAFADDLDSAHLQQFYYRYAEH